MDHDGSPPPPTKASLKAWWRSFTFAQRVKKESLSPKRGVVFGVPLRDSLEYASVQISTANANGDLYVWGFIPVVVAKCGLYLKENATEVEGTFRVNGSAKRMRELQALFETPPRYGKTLDWKKEHYTTHDVASVFRRYLTQMPEPVIPHELYHDFRNAMAKRPFVQDEAVKSVKHLIGSLPRANQYLLLYVLDLLSVFARKSDKNLMTAANLAVIFRPGLISHPTHEMSPEQHSLSQEVLEFLIAQQDWFMLDIPPPPPRTPVRNQSTEEEVYLMPGDEEEEGWKLVERGKVRLVRRRTTGSHGGPVANAKSNLPRPLSTAEPEPHSDLNTNVMSDSNPSPSPEPERGRSKITTGSVKRSLTVPTKKSPTDEQPKVLVKKSRPRPVQTQSTITEKVTDSESPQGSTEPTPISPGDAAKKP